MKLCRHYRTNCPACRRDEQLAIYHFYRNPVEAQNARNRLRYERKREVSALFDDRDLSCFLKPQAC